MMNPQTFKVANVRRAGDDFRSGLVLYSIQTAAWLVLELMGVPFTSPIHRGVFFSANKPLEMHGAQWEKCRDADYF